MHIISKRCNVCKQLILRENTRNSGYLLMKLVFNNNFNTDVFQNFTSKRTLIGTLLAVSSILCFYVAFSFIFLCSTKLKKIYTVLLLCKTYPPILVTFRPFLALHLAICRMQKVDLNKLVFLYNIKDYQEIQDFINDLSQYSICHCRVGKLSYLYTVIEKQSTFRFTRMKTKCDYSLLPSSSS